MNPKFEAFFTQLRSFAIAAAPLVGDTTAQAMAEATEEFANELEDYLLDMENDIHELRDKLDDIPKDLEGEVRELRLDLETLEREVEEQNE